MPAALLRLTSPFVKPRVQIQLVMLRNSLESFLLPARLRGVWSRQILPTTATTISVPTSAPVRISMTSSSSHQCAHSTFQQRGRFPPSAIPVPLSGLLFENALYRNMCILSKQNRRLSDLRTFVIRREPFGSVSKWMRRRIQSDTSLTAHK